MRNTNVFMCNSGHLNYCDEEPKKCKFCDSKKFGKIGVTVEVEDDYGVPDEPRYSNY